MNRGAKIAIVIVGIAVLAAFGKIGKTTEPGADTKEQALQQLRSTNAQAYLDELQRLRDRRWEKELEVLDPERYKQLLTERKAEQERSLQNEIAELKQEAKALLKQGAKTLSHADAGRGYRIYSRLSDLEPSAEHKAKMEVFSKALDQRYNPENFVSLEKFSWRKDGFGNIMMADFAIKNAADFAVKDIEVACSLSAPSGTSIDSNTRTIYQRIEPRQTKRVSDFNMGFVHNQAARSGCKIARVAIAD